MLNNNKENFFENCYNIASAESRSIGNQKFLLLTSTSQFFIILILLITLLIANLGNINSSFKILMLSISAAILCINIGWAIFILREYKRLKKIGNIHREIAHKYEEKQIKKLKIAPKDIDIIPYYQLEQKIFNIKKAKK